MKISSLFAMTKWTEAEHEAFLEGLETCGRGAWKKIAAKYVRTRTATQVATHAQKHYTRIEKRNSNKHRLRHSIFDHRRCASPNSSASTTGAVDDEECLRARRDGMLQMGLSSMIMSRWSFVQQVHRPTPRRPQVGWLPDLM